MPSISLYIQNGLALSTQRTHAAALKQFHTFCTTFNISTPFPVTEQLHSLPCIRAAPLPFLYQCSSTPFPVSEQLHSLSCIRAAPLRLLSAPGRPRLGSPDRQHLSGGSAQHATLAWPARPKGRLLPPNPVPSTGRNQEVTPAAPSPDEGAPSYYSPNPGPDQSYTQLSPPSQSAPMGGGLHNLPCCFFLFFQAG